MGPHERMNRQNFSANFKAGTYIFYFKARIYSEILPIGARSFMKPVPGHAPELRFFRKLRLQASLIFFSSGSTP